MNRRTLLGGLTLGTLSAPLVAGAQEAVSVHRVGFIVIFEPFPESPTLAAFRQGLHELGYVEGKNVTVETRFAEGREDRLPDLIADLLRLKIEVLVIGTVAGALAAKQATTTVPIVFAGVTEPLTSGIVTSLARPGGNVTGVATLESELGAKRLELFKEAFPTIARVAVLYDPTTSRSVLDEVKTGAERLTVQLRVLEVRAPEDLDGAFRKATEWRAAALSVLASPFFQSQRVRIGRLSVEHRLPAMVPHRAYAEAGGLFAYGPDFRDLNRRTAVFVDKILKGAKPGDLPVEQATKFELLINMKTAKALGLTIPQSLLLRADQVIE